MTPSTEVQQYDFEAAAIRETGLELAAQAEALVIHDDVTDAGAKFVLAIVTKGLKQAKARHDEVKAEPLAKCNAIDAAFNDAYEPFKTAKALIGTKAGEYFKVKKDAEEAARREAERLEREALAAKAKAEAEAAAAAKRGEEPAPAPEPVQVAPAPPIPVAQAVVKTEAGTVGMVEHRTWEIADGALIPIDYYVLDEARIGKEIRAGGEIAGIKVVITYTPRTH